jgi:hypothetical protein
LQAAPGLRERGHRCVSSGDTVVIRKHWDRPASKEERHHSFDRDFVGQTRALDLMRIPCNGHLKRQRPSLIAAGTVAAKQER